MDTADAASLIAGAVAGAGPVWADVGTGGGTFTRALCVLLGPEARVYAVARNAHALGDVEAWAMHTGASVITLRADFTREFELPGLVAPGLDGMLLANALHFVSDQARVLTRLVRRVRPGGRIVLVEYDRRGASPWVPYPVPAAESPRLSH